jgi:hypothetical protein
MSEGSLSLIVPSELWDYEADKKAVILNAAVRAWCDENISAATQFVEATETERYAEDLMALEEARCEDCGDIVSVYLRNFGVDGSLPALKAIFTTNTDYALFKLRWC